MRFDLDALCKHARAQIAVPPFPLYQIRQTRAEIPRVPITRRRGTLLAPVVLVSMLAAATAAEIWTGTRIVETPSRGVQISADTAVMVLKHPTPNDVNATVQKVNFPVTLPAGLPPGTYFRTMVRFGTGAIMLQYDLPGSWRRSNHLFNMILANPKSVNTNDLHRYKFTLQFGGDARKAVVWRIGSEDVIVPHSTIMPAELARIKEAMIKSSRQ